MDDNARYEVLRNDEDQYSLWLAGHEVPAGWHRVGKEGTKEECSSYRRRGRRWIGALFAVVVASVGPWA